METVRSNSTPTVYRKVCVVLLLSLLLLPAHFFPTPVLAQDGTTIHTVAPGENLSSIARRYNVSVASLMAYNGIRDANLIRPGQQIRIPSVVQPLATPTSAPAQPPIAPPPASGGSHDPLPTNTPFTPARPPQPGASIGYTAAGETVITVRSGDTLYGLSAQYGVSVSSIVQRNNLPSLVIIVSQRLIIPLRNAPVAPTTDRRTPTTSNNSPVSQPAATPAAANGGPNLLPTAVATPVSR